MIHRIWSDLPTFRALEFGPGLNVVLADKSVGATDRQSRNGAGKTSLVEAVHFLFGSEARPKSLFRSQALTAYAFNISADIGGHSFEVSRSGQRPNDVHVAGDASIFSIRPRMGKQTGELAFSRKDWCSVLGAAMFGLAAEESAGTGKGRFAPSFRSLFSYYVRRENDGGFIAPEQQNKKQAPWDQQVNVSYLLGLDASIPGRFQDLRQREKVMGEIRKAAKAGDLGGFFGTAADIRTRLIVSENRTARLQEQVASFHVVPEYEELEKEATRLTRKAGKLSDENTQDRLLVEHLDAALVREQPPAVNDLQNIYREAGVLLPDLVARRFDDVARFHTAIVENRRTHLAAEIGSAQARIQSRNAERARLAARRSQIMEILRGGGALDHFVKLQEEVARHEAETESLRHRLDLAEKLEATKSELKLERANLVKALRSDYVERDRVIREAVLLFEDLSEQLYERSGSLTITPGENGPEFSVKIDSERSKGIKNMQIFCFDMMIAELNARRGRGPGFLIHDSHLFDGVDGRQVAKALQLGADRAASAGFQYIVTMNSDMVPHEGFVKEFDINEYVLPVRLRDSDHGGLFGFRFNVT